MWRSNGWLVASAGNWRAIEFMRYDMEFPDPRGNHHKSLCMDLQENMVKAFDRNRVDVKTNEDGDVTDHSAYYILAARDNKLFYVDFNGHVEQVKRHAIGTGTEYALGQLDASDLGSAERRIKRAFINAAKRYRCLVGPYPVEKA